MGLDYDIDKYKRLLVKNRRVRRHRHAQKGMRNKVGGVIDPGILRCTRSDAEKPQGSRERKLVSHATKWTSHYLIGSELELWDAVDARRVKAGAKGVILSRGYAHLDHETHANVRIEKQFSTMYKPAVRHTSNL